MHWNIQIARLLCLIRHQSDSSIHLAVLFISHITHCSIARSLSDLINFDKVDNRRGLVNKLVTLESARDGAVVALPVGIRSSGKAVMT